MTETIITLTSTANGIIVQLAVGTKTVKASVPARHQLLAVINRVLRKARVPLRKLTHVAADLQGGTFSETRAVVTTANALGYALGILPAPHFVSAAYRGEPSIGTSTS
ncbi:MAG: hypothetical protein AAB579_02245 [Patescibacteria group bacterium]